MDTPEKISDRIAVIGISPRNGFFSQENITALVGRTLGEYEHAVAMIADGPATANWIAFGYAEDKAQRKARLDGNNYRHRVERARDGNACEPERISIPVWKKDIETRPEYQDNYRKIHALYETNASFQNAARETTRHFLASAQKGWNNGAHAITDMDKAVNGAVDYLLSELAFIEAAPAIYRAKTVDYVYHHEFPIYDAYRSGAFDGLARPQLGMKIFA